MENAYAQRIKTLENAYKMNCVVTME